MATTDILPFAIDPSADVQSQANFAAATSTAKGFANGIAEPAELNKVWRQSSFMAAGLANWLVTQGVNVPDDGDFATLVANLLATLAPKKFQAGAAGSVLTSIAAKIAAVPLNAVVDFECDNTGATNTTAALLAFYNACITTGQDGYIPAGTYKITPGQLRFFNSGSDKAWPNIFTAGNAEVVYLVDTATVVDAPIFEITTVAANGNHAYIGSYYWKGGCHGGITITDNSGVVSANRCGMALTGLWYTRFGVVTGNTLRSDLIRLPANTITPSNPDPYSCAFIKFEGLDAQSCVGFAMNNLNTVGLDSWEVESVSAFECQAGTWFGIGQGCKIKQFSVSGCAGWAFDDGTQSGATGGNRLDIDVAELDNPQYGIRINKLADFAIRQIRINHRYNGNSLNATNKYWPLLALDITGGASPNVNRGTIDIFNRIEAGGLLADLGQFMDCHNSSEILDVQISVDYADNGSLGVTDNWLLANNHTSTAMSILFTKLSKKLINTTISDVSGAQGEAATTLVKNTGWGTAAAKVLFSANQNNPSLSLAYDLPSSVYTAPRSGFYKLFASVPLTVAVGTRVRIGFYTTAQGIQCAAWGYQVNAGSQQHVAHGHVFLNCGDTVFVVADQNTGTASVAASPTTSGDEVMFVVQPLC